MTVLVGALMLSSGCVDPYGRPDNTGTGALVGGAFGALAGAAAGGHNQGEHALIGALAGAVLGGFIGHEIDKEQQERLRVYYPATYYKLQNNSAIYSGSPPPPPPPGVVVTPPLTPPPGYAYQPAAPSAAPQPEPSAAPPATTVQSQPSGPAPSTAAPSASQCQMQALTVDDIKALSAAGVKPDAINKQIDISHSTFTPAEIGAAQQVTPPIDPTVIAYMQNHQG